MTSEASAQVPGSNLGMSERLNFLRELIRKFTTDTQALRADQRKDEYKLNVYKALNEKLAAYLSQFKLPMTLKERSNEIDAAIICLTCLLEHIEKRVTAGAADEGIKEVILDIYRILADFHQRLHKRSYLEFFNASSSLSGSETGKRKRETNSVSGEELSKSVEEESTQGPPLKRARIHTISGRLEADVDTAKDIADLQAVYLEIADVCKILLEGPSSKLETVRLIFIEFVKRLGRCRHLMGKQGVEEISFNDKSLEFLVPTALDYIRDLIGLILVLSTSSNIPAERGKAQECLRAVLDACQFTFSYLLEVLPPNYLAQLSSSEAGYEKLAGFPAASLSARPQMPDNQIQYLGSSLRIQSVLAQYGLSISNVTRSESGVMLVFASRHGADSNDLNSSIIIVDTNEYIKSVKIVSVNTLELEIVDNAFANYLVTSLVRTTPSSASASSAHPVAFNR